MSNQICGDSSIVEQLPFQAEEGGAIPTSPLQLNTCKVVLTTRNEIKDFVEKWHYSKSINGIHSNYCFKLTNPQGEIIGAAIYGTLAMHNQWKRFGKTADDVIELRRLCCIDETPKNTESFFIGYTLRWLKKNTNISTVVSYADAEYGHNGTIYKASNWKMVDFKKGAPVILWNGKKYHDKALRTKYKGELKPYAKRLKEAVENGQAVYVKTKGKYTFVYELKKTTGEV